jgi:hypothetical protein
MEYLVEIVVYFCILCVFMKKVLLICGFMAMQFGINASQACNCKGGCCSNDDTTSAKKRGDDAKKSKSKSKSKSNRPADEYATPPPIDQFGTFDGERKDKNQSDDQDDRL